MTKGGLCSGPSKCYPHRNTDDADDPGEGVSKVVQLLLERCLLGVLLRFLLDVVVVSNPRLFAGFWFRFGFVPVRLRPSPQKGLDAGA